MTAGRKREKAESPGKPGQTCDYCGVSMHPLYAQTALGLLACDACLLNGNVEEEFAALAKLRRGVDVQTLTERLSLIEDPALRVHVDDALDQLDRARALFDLGEKVASMEAVQAAWNASAAVHAIDSLFALASHGFKSKKQRERAGFSSGEQRAAARQPEWDRWQRRAIELKTSNPRRSKTDICTQIAEEFGVTDRAVRARVQLPGTERPRSRGTAR